MDPLSVDQKESQQPQSASSLLNQNRTHILPSLIFPQDKLVKYLGNLCLNKGNWCFLKQE